MHHYQFNLGTGEISRKFLSRGVGRKYFVFTLRGEKTKHHALMWLKDPGLEAFGLSAQSFTCQRSTKEYILPLWECHGTQQPGLSFYQRFSFFLCRHPEKTKGRASPLQVNSRNSLSPLSSPEDSPRLLSLWPQKVSKSRRRNLWVPCPPMTQWVTSSDGGQRVWPRYIKVL